MGAMKELAILLDELEYGKLYDVEYGDELGNTVKKYRIVYHDKAFVTYSDRQYLLFLDSDSYLYIDPYKVKDIKPCDASKEEMQLKEKTKIQLLIGEASYRWKPDFTNNIGVADYSPFCMLRIDDVLYPAIYLRYDPELVAYVFEYRRDDAMYQYIVTKDAIWNGDCYIVNHKTGKEVPRSSLVIKLEKTWNYDELTIGRPYRLVKDGEECFGLLSSIHESHLLFVTAEREEHGPSFATDPQEPDNCYKEIIVRPGLSSADYDVYSME